MDRLDAMNVFIAVAEERGFSAAARRLGLSASKVTRTVSALEDHLGVRLLHRTTRVTRLTEAGHEYLPQCRTVLAAASDAEAAATGTLVAPSGTLNVTAPVRFGNLFVTDIACTYLARHPDVSVRLVLVDRTVAVIEEGFDVAIRIGHLEDSTLTTIGVGHVRQVVCGAPGYLAERGRPQRPRQLRDHRVIRLPPDMALHRWTFFNRRGRELNVTPASRLQVSSVEAATRAARSGHGLARLLSYQVADAVARGELETVMRRYEPPRLPVQVVFPSGRHASSKVRAFLDLAVDQLRLHLRSAATAVA